MLNKTNARLFDMKHDSQYPVGPCIMYDLFKLEPLMWACGESLDELDVSLSAQWTRGSGCDDGVTSPGTGQGAATSVSRHATLHLLF